jgi:hypothetical protein
MPNGRPTPSRRSSDAERQRRTRAVRAYRQRQAAGLAVLRVPVVEYDVVQALIEAKRLTVGQALDRTQVEHVVAEILHEWAQRWLRDTCNR